MLNCKLTCDVQACERTRVLIEGAYIANMRDRQRALHIIGFLRAIDDYKENSKYCLRLDALFLHEDGFLLYRDTTLHRFLLEENRVEPFSFLLPYPERCFDPGDCHEIKLSPRWEALDWPHEAEWLFRSANG